MAEEPLPDYLKQQAIPGWSGILNNMVRALMAGNAQAKPQMPTASPGPYQPPITAPPPMQPPTRGGPPPMMLPQPSVPYTGQAMGINGPGPMGPLLMQPPQG